MKKIEEKLANISFKMNEIASHFVNTYEVKRSAIYGIIKRLTSGDEIRLGLKSGVMIIGTFERFSQDNGMIQVNQEMEQERESKISGGSVKETFVIVTGVHLEDVETVSIITTGADIDQSKVN